MTEHLDFDERQKQDISRIVQERIDRCNAQHQKRLTDLEALSAELSRRFQAGEDPEKLMQEWKSRSALIAQIRNKNLRDGYSVLFDAHFSGTDTE